VLSATILLLLFASAFIVILSDPELRDAEPVAGERIGPDERSGAYLLYALAVIG